MPQLRGYAAVCFAMALLASCAHSQESGTDTPRWDLMMIKEAPVWGNLLVKYGCADRLKVWPEQKAALQKVIRESPDSQWADDAALILACGKASWEGDLAGAISDLIEVASRYPEGQTVVVGWQMDIGCTFDAYWLGSLNSLVFLDAKGNVRTGKPFGKFGNFTCSEREQLLYFVHLERYPRHTKDVARLFIAQMASREGNVKQAEAALAAVIAMPEELAQVSKADREAASLPDGYLIKRMWRPEHDAYLCLMEIKEAQGEQKKALELGRTLAELCSNDGWYWKTINRTVGDLYAKRSLWREAEDQYASALAGGKQYKEEIEKRRKDGLGVPQDARVAPRCYWSEKEEKELLDIEKKRDDVSRRLR